MRASKRLANAEHTTQGVSNRDIKLENTLLDRLAPGHKPVVKLCGELLRAVQCKKNSVGFRGRVGSACIPGHWMGSADLLHRV